MNLQEAQAKIAELEAEKAELKAKARSRIGLKIGDKGGVCVTGLQRFPLTLYADQWQAFHDFGGTAKVLEYAAAHKAELAPPLEK